MQSRPPWLNCRSWQQSDRLIGTNFGFFTGFHYEHILHAHCTSPLKSNHGLDCEKGRGNNGVLTSNINIRLVCNAICVEIKNSSHANYEKAETALCSSLGSPGNRILRPREVRLRPAGCNLIKVGVAPGGSGTWHQKPFWLPSNRTLPWGQGGQGDHRWGSRSHLNAVRFLWTAKSWWPGSICGHDIFVTYL